MEYVLNLFGIPRIETQTARDFFSGFFEHIHDHFIPHARNNYHPHILSHRMVALFSTLLIAFKIFLLAVMSFGPVLPVFSSAITEENIIALTNQSRKDFSLGMLTQNTILDSAAQAKANDMLKRGYFSHNTPTGETPWTFITSAGYNYLTAGENLAINFTQAEDVENAWMNSPGHKANIVNKGFEDIGIGIAKGDFQGHEAIIVVQMFGSSAEQKVTLLTEPTKVQTQKVPEPIVQNPQTEPLQKPQPLAIGEPKINTGNNSITIDVTASDNAVKVLAVFGEKAVMLTPKALNDWQGEINLGDVAKDNSSIYLKAFDLSGNVVQTQAAYFSSSTPSNYSILGATAEANSSFLGNIFNANNFEKNFYLIFIAGILASMVLAIGIKRHVQHLSLVVNSSFVVILACMLWLGS